MNCYEVMCLGVRNWGTMDYFLALYELLMYLTEHYIPNGSVIRDMDIGLGSEIRVATLCVQSSGSR
jgi:hypothetical protein